MPQDLFEDQGELSVVFWDSQDRSFPCFLHYEINGRDFIIDCDEVKDIWEPTMKDDIYSAIDRKLGSFFLSRLDLNLNIIGI